MPRIRVERLALSLDGFGAGESLFADLDLRAPGHRGAEHAPTARATHVVPRKAR
jgi:hypothetical protein